MDRLEGVRELLDGELDDPEALRGNLRDLRRLNRLTRGVDLSIRAIDALGGDADPLTILDVGTGGADIPVALLAHVQLRGRRVSVTAVDNRAEVLEAARAERPAIDQLEGLTLQLADGTRLPYADRSFDIVHASLVLHHLEADEAGAFLRELGRVARRGVVINDLSRGRLLVAGASILVRLLSRNPYTRHDAPLSVRRAYTVAEARRLLEAAGLRPAFEVQGALRHRWAIAATPR